MLSLDKATKPEQVVAFLDRFPGQSVVVMPKLDGFSLALVYEDGRLARAITRGDGTTGDDVTVLVRALVDDLPLKIAAPRRVEVRGEAVMLRSTFAAYNAAHPDKPLINPRGGAAGTVRAKDPKTVAERRLRFFAFDLDADEAPDDLEAALRDLGFEAATMEHCDDAASVQKVIAAIEAGRDELDYDLDGAVMRLADRNAYAAAGTRANSPRGALAFKFAAEEKTTVLADVLWDVGKTGKVAPVAALEPVFVGGTTVTRATLANQEVIRARGIRIGDTVLVRRAGDVIPFVAGVLDESKRTGHEREIVPPSRVSELRRAADRAGQQPRAVLHERRLPGADRPAPDPLGLARRGGHRGGRAGVDRAAGRGPACSRTRATSTRSRREQLLEFDRIAEVSAARMVDSIDASRAVGLRRALIGLSIPMASEGTAARLCRAGFASLEAVADAGADALVQVEDIGPKVAAQPRRAPGALAAGAGAAARAWRQPRRARRGPAAAGRRRCAAGGQDRRHHRHDLGPAQRREDPAPDFQRLAEKAGATTAHRFRPTRTC